MTIPIQAAVLVAFGSFTIGYWVASQSFLREMAELRKTLNEVRAYRDQARRQALNKPETTNPKTGV